MTHNDLQKRVVGIMTRKGNGFNVVSSNRRGRPDILGHIGMIFLAVEVKRGKDRLRPAQRHTALDIVSKGGLAIVVHEKHLAVFEQYVATIVREVEAHSPCTYIGKPIPPELKVDDFKNVGTYAGEAI